MIATTTVKRYANKLEERLGAVRLATEQARAVVEAAEERDLEINEALLRLVQQHLFTVLVELNGADAERGESVGVGAQCERAGARVNPAKEVRRGDARAASSSKVAAAQKAVETAKARGLTEAGAAQIKNVLMEITE